MPLAGPAEWTTNGIRMSVLSSSPAPIRSLRRRAQSLGGAFSLGFNTAQIDMRIVPELMLRDSA